MPPRLSKRHQREIEELEELSLSKSQLGQKEKVDAPRPPAQGIGFSAVSRRSVTHKTMRPNNDSL